MSTSSEKDLVIFDMDGVLVDVNESYSATIQATVKHFTGYEPSREEIQDWKNRGGWNDDWRLSTRLGPLPTWIYRASGCIRSGARGKAFGPLQFAPIGG